MKMLFVNEAGDHLGCLEFNGEDSVTIEKYKPEFQADVVDAPEKDDGDETEGKYAQGGADLFKEAATESEPIDQEGEEQQIGKFSGPKKFKGGKKGMF